MTVSARRRNRRGSWQRLLRDKVTIVALIVFGLIVLVSIFAPLLSRHGTTEILGPPVQAPSANHWLGTDEVGRDVFARLLDAGRVSLLVGIVSTAIATGIGIPWGLVSGYFGGVTDTVSMRLTDALLAFPGIILALAVVAIFPPSIINVMIAIGIVQIPRFTRLVRAEVLSLKTREFVQAERALGATTYRILRHAILPNVLGVVSIQIGLTFATAVLIEASLSFLGLGVQPPTPSWGGMLSRARLFLSRNAIYSIASGGAIFATVLSVSLVGDAVAGATDPRTITTTT